MSAEKNCERHGFQREASFVFLFAGIGLRGVRVIRYTRRDICHFLLQADLHTGARHSQLHSLSEARIVDSSGALSNVGLVQVRMKDGATAEYGTVCGMNLVRLC